MAHATGTRVRTQRLTAAAATVLLALATGFALGRVFDGAVISYKLMLVAVLSALTACALERRNLLLATLVSAAALLVVVGWLVVPHTLRVGFPTLETLRAIGSAARLVGEQARVQVAPSQPTAPLMLAAITATWAAIFSAHALAFRAGSPLLALLPPIALVAFADTVLDQLIKPLYGLVFLGAALVMIFADGLRRLQSWGPVWTGPGRDAKLGRTAGRGARRVGLAALGLALVAPALIPGFGSRAIVHLGGGGSVRIDPLVDVANQLHQSTPRALFTVTTAEPTYYRFQVDAIFDGTSGWRYDTSPQTTDLSSDPLVLNPDIDTTAMGSVASVTEQFRFSTEIDDPWLPYAYPAEHFDVGQPIAWDPVTGVAGVGGPLDVGTTYAVTSFLLRPTPTQLRALPPASDPRYTALPGDLDPRITALAKSWTQGATSTYAKVMAIQDHLRGPSFTYSTDVPSRTSQTALADFLLHDRRGFCQQFAGAMAVLLRALGIPARVAVGYDAGTELSGPAHTWGISTKDAHAWPEVLFPTYGWLQFEPTPTKAFLPDQSYLTTPTGSTPSHPCNIHKGHGSCTTGRPGTKTHGGNHLGKNADLNVPHAAFEGGALGGQRRPPTPWWRSSRRLLLLALALGLVALLLVPPVRAVRRRRRLKRAGAVPRRLILATYDVFTERAAELGFPRDPGETLEEYRRRVAASGLLRDGDLDRLTDITASAAYAAADPEAMDAREARDAAARTLADLRKGTPLLQRVRGHYRSTR